MKAHIKTLKRTAKNFIHDESGASAIEYGLIAALIGIAIMVGLSNTGRHINRIMWCVRGNLILNGNGGNLGSCRDAGIGFD